jgi:hypothetical protein
MSAQKRCVVHLRTSRNGWGWCMKWCISAPAVQPSPGDGWHMPTPRMQLSGDRRGGAYGCATEFPMVVYTMNNGAIANADAPMTA